MTGPCSTVYRTRPVRQTFAISLVLALALLGVSRADAQLDPELASSGGYAWGEDRASEEADDPLRIMAFAGAGFGLRLIRNIDPEFSQEFIAPFYLDLGAAVFLPGAEIRHGFGLALSTNLTADTPSTPYASPALGQWLITPSYHFLIPLRRVIPELSHDWLHIQGRVGIPLVFSTNLQGDVATVTAGGELAAAFHFKFLAGLGLYVEANVSVFGGVNDTIHPLLGLDAGLLFDYEVLP